MSHSKGEPIRFVLDGAIKEVAEVSPTLTVLNYLREVERRCGTKEGCAEGDCGACTVVLGEIDGGQKHYRAANACLLFLPVLDGKELVTVESLAGARGALHPVQRAMVECHAAQCGFCTPGLVMSIFALRQSGEAPTRDRVNDALAGNLCRCTGYRPIVAATERACEPMGLDRASADEERSLALLSSIERHETFAFEHAGQRYFAPVSGEALADLFVRYPDAQLLAGGTDIGVWVAKQHRELRTLIYLGAVREFARIKTDGNVIEIGAGATYAQVRALLGASYPDFGEIIRRIGSEQVRNLGTIGGNIGNASPIGDTLPPLIALGATVILRRGGAQREVALDDFFIGYRRTALRPGEFIECVRVPLPTEGLRFGAYKISKRFDQDISAVCGAFAVQLTNGVVGDVRLCYGGMAATPMRARACEKALVGRLWNEASIEAALPALDADFASLSDMRASAAYRQLVARNLLRKFQFETAERPGRTRLALREEALA